jgi:hypothetical protein
MTSLTQFWYLKSKKVTRNGELSTAQFILRSQRLVYHVELILHAIGLPSS